MSSNKYKKIITVGLLLGILFTAVPHVALTQTSAGAAPGATGGGIFGFIGNIATDAIYKILYAITYVLSQVGSVIFTFAAFLASLALKMNFAVFDLASNRLVGVGWQITRDVANLGFVLIIVIIAIATILRREEYGVQKLLPKLIAAAILVNFSLTIAGVFVDFSHVITKFFFDRIQGGDIADVLAGAFQPQTLFQTSQQHALTAAAGGADTLTTGLMNLIFIIIFTLVGAFTILAFAVLLLLRYLHLSFLGVVAPIIWLFWIVPQLSSQFGKWWTSFFRWTFFAPASAFFMYLAIQALNGLKTLTDAQGSVFGTLDGDLQNILRIGSQMIVTTGIMLGGLIIADKMGVKGASGAMALGGKLSGAAKGWVGARTAGLRDRAITAGAGSQITKGRSLLEMAAGGLRGLPVIGGVGRALSSVSSNAKARLNKGVDEEIAKRKNETKENILSETKAVAGGATDATGYGPRVESPAKLAALGIMAAEKGVWDDLSGKEQERIIDAQRRTGKSAEILKHRPELAGKFEPSKEPSESQKDYDARIEKAIEKAVGKLEDPLKLAAATLGSIAPYLRPGHLEKIGKEGSLDQKNAIKNSLEKDINKNNPKAISDIEHLRNEMDDFAKEIDDAKAKGDTTGAAQLINNRKKTNQQLKQLLTGLGEEEKRALEKRDLISGNTNWRSIFP